MIPSAHVTIIGSGIIGLSCAYWLSKFGVEDIVVVDRNKGIAEGATKQCAGFVTQNFNDKVMINLSQESFKLFRHITCNLRNQGQIVLYESLDEIEKAKKNIAVQKESHVRVEELDKNALYHLIPAAFLDDIKYATRYPGDGIADVRKLIKWFKNQCDADGVVFLLNTTVRNIHKDSKVQEVVTDKGRIKTNIVINAAGAHAGVIGHLAGIAVPVLPLRMHAVTTKPFPSLSNKMPCIHDTKYNLKMMPYQDGFFFMQKYHHEEYGFKTDVEEHFVYDMLDDAEKRFPAFASVKVKNKMTGYYAMTPDEKPIIGETELKGFYCCTGFSGQGFTFSLVAGMIIADLITQGKSRYDFSGLTLARFRRQTTPPKSDKT